MLPAQHKLHRSGDFSVTVRRGRRFGRRTIVLHYLDAADASVSRSGGPRVGFVVSKGVGNSVFRHAVTRKLRHVVMDSLDDVPSTADMVIRALPAAAGATSEELADDVRKALARARKR